MMHETFAVTAAGAQELAASQPHLPAQLHATLALVQAHVLGRARLMPRIPRGDLPPAQCIDTLLQLGLIERCWMEAWRTEVDPSRLSASEFDESRHERLHAFLTEVLHSILPPRVLQHELDCLNRAHGMRTLVRRLQPIQALVAQYAGAATAREFNRVVREILLVAPEAPGDGLLMAA